MHRRTAESALYCVTAGKSPEQLVQPHDEEHPEKAAFRCVLQGSSKRAGNFLSEFFIKIL